jgi:hypothetical protein
MGLRIVRVEAVFTLATFGALAGATIFGVLEVWIGGAIGAASGTSPSLAGGGRSPGPGAAAAWAFIFLPSAAIFPMGFPFVRGLVTS